LDAQAIKDAEFNGSRITENEYKNSKVLYSEGVQWYEGMTRESAEISKEFNDAARKRAQILQDASTSQSVAGFAVGFGAGVFEPKNLAVGVAAAVTLPGLGATGVLGRSVQRAYQMRKTATQMRKTATLGTRALIGGAEGVAAGVAVEPSNRYSAKILQQDYTMLDSVFNVATSTAFGAGLPVAAKGLSNASPFIKEKIAKFKGRTMDVVTAEIDLATTQFTNGQRVDVGVIEAAEIGSVAKKPVAEQAKVAEALVRYTESPEFEARFAKAGAEVRDASGQPKKFFHGTANTDFTEFNTRPEPRGVSAPQQVLGAWFTEDGKRASAYAYDYKNVTPNNGNVRIVYLALEKPYVLKRDELAMINSIADKDLQVEAFLKLRNKLEKEGYDGVKVESLGGEGESIVAFYPEKIIPAFGEKSLADIIAQADTSNAQALAKAQADAVDPANDTLIDYSALDQIEARRITEPTEIDAEAYYQNAESEIRQMIDQDILNEADLAEYRQALEELQSRAPVDALETLNLCLTRG
jgi:hypothetical protein